ncbi:Sec20 protein [Besnoitia besnoiti]|uniref:Sec20 protein n=1 Tax=Besnoitia besnoiti TaxID=94643 RepID=A0A2A9MQA9_BESBE|nr:Sec20 protein [Besnoitia besnoiti]PFH38377.1 Sec20 protein [Besnoitia besnoiti]
MNRYCRLRGGSGGSGGREDRRGERAAGGVGSQGAPPAQATEAAVVGPPHRARKAPGVSDAAQQQQALEQQMLQRLPQAEAVAQLQDVARDLALLEDSLRSLLNDSAPGHEAQHDQLVHFRGRVARRISRYALLVRKSQGLVERLLDLQEQQLRLLQSNRGNGAGGGAEALSSGTLSSSAPLASLSSLSPSLTSSLADVAGAAEAVQAQREQLLQLQQRHQHNLQTFKSQLSAWWQRTERHFHTMRMANYVNALEATENAAANASAAENAAAALSSSRGASAATSFPPSSFSSSYAASFSLSSAQPGASRPNVGSVYSALHAHAVRKPGEVPAGVAPPESASNVPAFSASSSGNFAKPAFTSGSHAGADARAEEAQLHERENAREGNAPVRGEGQGDKRQDNEGTRLVKGTGRGLETERETLERREEEDDDAKERGGSQQTQQLRETRNAMAEELQRMQETQRQLQKSSGAIEQTETTYNVFGDRLASAKGILSTLKKRAETDSQLIWLAFLFFLGCCAFVVLRRLGILRLIISLTAGDWAARLFLSSDVLPRMQPLVGAPFDFAFESWSCIFALPRSPSLAVFLLPPPLSSTDPSVPPPFSADPVPTILPEDFETDFAPRPHPPEGDDLPPFPPSLSFSASRLDDDDADAASPSYEAAPGAPSDGATVVRSHQASHSAPSSRGASAAPRPSSPYASAPNPHAAAARAQRRPRPSNAEFSAPPPPSSASAAAARPVPLARRTATHSAHPSASSAASASQNASPAAADACSATASLPSGTGRRFAPSPARDIRGTGRPLADRSPASVRSAAASPSSRPSAPSVRPDGGRASREELSAGDSEAPADRGNAQAPPARKDPQARQGEQTNAAQAPEAGDAQAEGAQEDAQGSEAERGEAERTRHQEAGFARDDEATNRREATGTEPWPLEDTQIAENWEHNLESSVERQGKDAVFQGGTGSGDRAREAGSPGAEAPARLGDPKTPASRDRENRPLKLDRAADTPGDVRNKKTGNGVSSTARGNARRPHLQPTPGSAPRASRRMQ